MRTAAGPSYLLAVAGTEQVLGNTRWLEVVPLTPAAAMAPWPNIQGFLQYLPGLAAASIRPSLQDTLTRGCTGTDIPPGPGRACFHT